MPKQAFPANQQILQLKEREKKLREALQLAFELLEQYAPTWYTEQHHDQIESALRG